MTGEAAGENGAQGHHQSEADEGDSSQILGILSYLFPLPNTPSQLSDNTNHRGSREKRAP